MIPHVRLLADFGRDATHGSSPLGAGSRRPRRDDVHSGAELSLIAQALIVAARGVPSNIGLTAGRAAPRLIIGNISMGQSGLRPRGIICGRDTRRGGQRRDRDEYEGSHDGPPSEGSQCEVMTISSSMSVRRAFRVSGCCGLCHITYGVGRPPVVRRGTSSRRLPSLPAIDGSSVPRTLKREGHNGGVPLTLV